MFLLDALAIGFLGTLLAQAIGAVVERVVPRWLLLGGFLVMLGLLACVVVMAEAVGGHIVALVVGSVGALGMLSILRGTADPALASGIVAAWVARRLHPTPPRR